ncbi:hypothetical protein BABINDRAFT_10569 [Babjeviella inositovora NRRL Y-12698]|uniref:Uncharacterized protein n=1 Tax=Babjeviella inositovora NRRL Y-12698 TaxID=984486 RepID=A0A1E3QHK6_9ASCO|nr:uncharacterized protein BABINDRAFT_10569 [Babjeviella inositovora NRRL Y-12698]ODQ76924.1 hypothetical protein BABINDRAFT_10569 [Babjeviella inositovora NRRL Y-12698]
MDEFSTEVRGTGPLFYHTYNKLTKSVTMWWVFTKQIKASLRKGQGVPHGIRMGGFLLGGYSLYAYIMTSGPSNNALQADKRYGAVNGKYAYDHHEAIKPVIKY